jgi:hypothetical protein
MARRYICGSVYHDPCGPGQPRMPPCGTQYKPGGYCIWQYTNGAWVAKVHSCEEGYDCGGPPTMAGKFQGEIVQKRCERQQKGRKKPKGK